MSYTGENGQDLNALVADIGSFNSRVGYAGEDFPKCNIRSTYGTLPKHSPNRKQQKTNKSHSESKHEECLYDMNVFTYPNRYVADHHKTSNIEDMQCHNPVTDGLITDWDSLEILWRYMYNQYLGINYRRDICDKHQAVENEMSLENMLEHASPLLMVEKSYSTPQCRHRSCEFAFETLHSPALFLSKEAVLSCYATGRTSGCVVDMGYSGTTVSPVLDGYVDTKGINRSIIGGCFLDQLSSIYINEINSNASKANSASLVNVTNKTTCHYKAYSALIQQQYHVNDVYARVLDREVSKDFREAICNKILLPEDNITLPPLVTTNLNIKINPMSANYSSKDMQLPPVTYELPDGITLSCPIDRYAINETLMSNARVEMAYDTLFSSPSQSTPLIPYTKQALPELLLNSITHCDAESNNILLNNIICIGGVSRIANMNDRLKLEMENILYQSILNSSTANSAANMALSNANLSNKLAKLRICSTNSNYERGIAAWLGGSIIGSLSTFHDMWISKAEYEENGSYIVDKKCP